MLRSHILIYPKALYEPESVQELRVYLHHKRLYMACHISTFEAIRYHWGTKENADGKPSFRGPSNWSN